MNLGIPPPAEPARSKSPRLAGTLDRSSVLSAPPRARSSEKEVANGEEKEKEAGWELAEVSKLPEEESIRRKTGDETKKEEEGKWRNLRSSESVGRGWPKEEEASSKCLHEFMRDEERERER